MLKKILIVIGLFIVFMFLLQLAFPATHVMDDFFGVVRDLWNATVGKHVK